METKNKNKTTSMLIIATLLLALALFSIANFPIAVAKTTDFWACFDYGEVRTYCSDYRPPETCDISSGCKICMGEYRESENCYVGGNFNDCTRYAPVQCLTGGATTTFDLTAPTLTIMNPLQNEIYSSKKILLNFTLDEEAEVSYKNLNDKKPKWEKVCRHCTEFANERTFDEGLNLLNFRARDPRGNTNYYNLTFTVDSVKPKIVKTFPSRGWANGDFEISFKEENPKELVLQYGNDLTGLRTQSVDLSSCTHDKKTLCMASVDLSDYDGQEIEYSFSLKDVADNLVVSKKLRLNVDSTLPRINNEDYFSLEGKYGYFSISITEQNFDEVVYSYIDKRGKEKEKTICSKLKEGLCEKKISFRDGNYDIDLIVRDEAGNEVQRSLSFIVDSKKPKISKVIPSRGWATGDFEIQFTEDNPTDLYLHYGNELTGYSSRKIDINEDSCTFARKTSCFTNVDLEEYDGQEIEVWFTMSDIMERNVESKKYTLHVDTTAPVINNKDLFTLDGRYVYFHLNITEENFAEAIYVDSDDPKLREKRLCSRLKDGICAKKVRFSEGPHELTIQVLDESGNSVGVPVGFEII